MTNGYVDDWFVADQRVGHGRHEAHAPVNGALEEQTAVAACHSTEPLGETVSWAR